MSAAIVFWSVYGFDMSVLNKYYINGTQFHIFQT